VDIISAALRFVEFLEVFIIQKRKDYFFGWNAWEQAARIESTKVVCFHLGPMVSLVSG
jgi:hypothetical protein